MDEFVAQSRKDRPQEECRFRQHLSFSSQGNQRPNFKGDERGISAKRLPQIVETKPSHPCLMDDCLKKDDGCALDDDSIINNDEKLSDKLDTNFGPARKEEPEVNRYSFFSSEIEQTIHAPELGDLILPGESFRDLFELRRENGSTEGAWWLDVISPSEDELEMFQRAFGIHRLTAEDIEAQEIREKVELFKTYYFVCFRSFFQMDKNHEDYLAPVNFYMVVFREGILTFTYAPSPHQAEVRKRIGKLRNYINLTADWISYALM